MTTLDLSKAKKRIKRSVVTGESQSRVRPLGDEKHFVYETEHHIREDLFHVDSLRRIKWLGVVDGLEDTHSW
jgi:hypothetical protein